MKFGGPERFVGEPSRRERELEFENGILDQDLERAKQASLEDGLTQWDNEIKLTEQNQQVERQKQQIEHQTQELTTDTLTGAASLAVFTLQLDQAIKMTRRQIPSSLVYIDVDHFKKINDTFGHPAGDAVLKGIAAYLMGAVRESDLVARIGGEEFAILLSGSNEHAPKKAEELRAGIEALTYRGHSGLKVTVSSGVVRLDIDKTPNAETARKYADKALYDAKEGRNRVVAYTEGA